MGSRGDGIALHEGQRCFVPYTLPGERVSAEPQGRRGEGIAAALVEVLAPSRHRIAPACRHFGRCGGCALQHWRSDAYADWKAGLIRRALDQRGVAAPEFDPSLVGLPGERRRADVVVRRGLAGFHERNTARAIDIAECPVLTPRIVALLPALRTVLAGDGMADAVVNDTDSGLDLLIRSHRRRDLDLALRERLVRWAEDADVARLSWGDKADAEPIVERRKPVLTYGDVTIVPPPGAFLQATRRAEQAMRDSAAAWLAGARRVADLFAGIGALTVGRPWRTSLFESDRPSVGAARRLAGVAAERRDLFRNPLLAQDLGGFDAVLLDPPRAGAAAQVAELARSSVARIVHASCDPSTFARDARTLQDAGYRLRRLLPIDQFLWSAHVELIALFAR